MTLQHASAVARPSSTTRPDARRPLPPPRTPPPPTASAARSTTPCWTTSGWAGSPPPPPGGRGWRKRKMLTRKGLFYADTIKNNAFDTSSPPQRLWQHSLRPALRRLRLQRPKPAAPFPVRLAEEGREGWRQPFARRRRRRFHDEPSSRLHEGAHRPAALRAKGAGAEGKGERAVGGGKDEGRNSPAAFLVLRNGRTRMRRKGGPRWTASQ